jgi:hypothetical protein
MEILKVGVFMYLFFHLSWQSLFTLIGLYNIVMYYIKNKHLLMNDPNFINICIFLVIITLESLSLYAQVADLYLKKYLIYRKINYYFTVANKLYFKMKSKIVSFMHSQVYLKSYELLNDILQETSNEIKINDLEKNNSKEDKINAIDSDVDALKFLNSLKKIKE